MKIWQLTNLLGNDELTTCNKNGQEVFEDGFNGIPMLSTWKPIQMKTYKHMEKADLLSFEGESFPTPPLTLKQI